MPPYSHLVSALEELGISPAAVLRRAGLPMGLLDQSRIWVNTEEMSELYAAIQEISGDPGIGLRLGSEERPDYYSPIAIAALYSRSFRDALNQIARYKRLTSPQEIRILERGKECAVEFVWLLAEKAEAPGSRAWPRGRRPCERGGPRDRSSRRGWRCSGARHGS